jgi:hypothetical protein
MTKSCEHFEKLDAKEPKTPQGCEECLAQGGEWVHLRLCLECGHVGCCDNSPRKHATKHFHRSGHAVIRSFEPGENWGWCFVHKVTVDPVPRFGLETIAHV